MTREEEDRHIAALCKEFPAEQLARIAVRTRAAEVQLREKLATFYEGTQVRARHVERLEEAVRSICKEVGQHGTEDVSEEKLQTTIDEVHCICMKAMPELDPDSEDEDEA